MTGILCSLPLIGAPQPSAPPSALTVALNRSSVTGSSSSSNISTNSVRATASLGDSPYTYAWSRVSGDSSISATSASSANTSLTRTGCVAGTSYAGVWRCRATDSAGNTAYSDDVSVTITCTVASGGGGGGGGGTTPPDGGTFLGIDNDSAYNDGTAPVTASWTIYSNGSYGDVGTWNSSSTVGSSYEVKATLTSGGLFSGTVGSWLAISSNRTWSVKDSSADGASATAALNVQIRQAGTTTVLDSATVTLTAVATS